MLHALDSLTGNIVLTTHAGLIRATFAKGPEAEPFNALIEFGQFLELPTHEDQPL